MIKSFAILAIIAGTCLAQKTTIDIEAYKKSKAHTFTERTYTVGKHAYTVVNIRPAATSDTNCISAVVIDKRKYVLFDVGVSSGPFGIIVPVSQPVTGGLLILKASPLDGKLFLVLQSGKVVTLPGDRVMVDSAGSCVYCVWVNDQNARLTVFDYKNLRLIFTTTQIAEPKQWYTDGFTNGFESTDGTYYTVDFLQKAVIKGEKPSNGLTPIAYVVDLATIDRATCCGPAVMKK